MPDAQHCDHEYVKVAFDESPAAETENGVWNSGMRVKNNSHDARDALQREKAPKAATHRPEQKDDPPNLQWQRHSAANNELLAGVPRIAVFRALNAT